MAASGIAEHNEARRHEMMYLRKAFLQKGVLDPRSLKVAQNNAEQVSRKKTAPVCTCYNHQMRSYDQNAGHDVEKVDGQSRLAHYRQMQHTQYSAKLPNRYTTIDYMSQW